MSQTAGWWSSVIDSISRKLPYRLRLDRSWVFGFVLGSSIFVSSASLAVYWQTLWRKKATINVPRRPIELRRNEVLDGVTSLIGNTPLVRIKSLCDLTGHEILVREALFLRRVPSPSESCGLCKGKAEYLNPGGSPKDRVALKIIEQAEDDGLLHPHTGSTIFEGTVGSTGISIATVARAKGYDCCIIMPDDVAPEKADILLKLGARVDKVRPVAIVSTQHYVNLARERAKRFGRTELVGPDPHKILPRDTAISAPLRDDLVVTEDPVCAQEYDDEGESETHARGFFADQFENLANFDAHYQGTGPEIWRQTNGEVDAFVAGAGSGGTLAGIAVYLKERNKKVRIVLADPQGSGLYNKVRNGVMYSSVEAEGTRRRYQVDSIVEGVGINRITANMAKGLHLVDDAIKITDEEAVIMSRHLVEHDGLFLGSSSAVNLLAACRLAKSYGQLGGKKTIITILCDSGTRHFSKFWSDDYLKRHNIIGAQPLDTLRDIL